ncbi:DUF6088 family protein [Marinobacter xestospongiae]|uniref:DUF6088 family protein n=1 Tax=Marinobacter xestospongiae TaxID=994319 RepID=A0ABU3W1F9_9GAMM|nr:DUF6088 family protein [Marinobacter xestospongiae]MDV2080374.1 DUF6088 family protein [Marinobacter xestospongiae]
MTGKRSLLTKISEKIRKSKNTVFLREDFSSLGDYDQVGRALSKLVARGRLVRIGKGLYAKARLNRITGAKMLAAPGGFDQVSKEALNRLGVNWAPGRAEVAYQNGSTQIPSQTVVRVYGRFNRQISYRNYRLKVEAVKA